MKKQISIYPITLFVIGIVIVLTCLSIYNTFLTRTIYTGTKAIYKDILIIDGNDQTDQFLAALRTFEQSNAGLKSRRETVIDGKSIKSQYIGAWQVGDAARETTGFGRYNNEEGYKRIMNDSILQLDMIKALLRFNCKVLDYYIKKYDQTRVEGHFITKSGILAMAHLVGAGKVIQYFDTNGKVVSKDGNNVIMTKYLELNGFNIRL